jgi:DNA-binding response OmpR family regulator
MPYSNEKILIVDDERRMCDSLKALLSVKGFDVRTRSNGHDALKYLREESVDLILLDISMEEMDGFRVMERIGREHLDIPVIIIGMCQ